MDSFQSKSFDESLNLRHVVRREVKNVLKDLIKERKIPKLRKSSRAINESINHLLHQYVPYLQEVIDRDLANDALTDSSLSQDNLSEETKHLLLRNIEVIEFRLLYLEMLVSHLEEGIKFIKEQRDSGNNWNVAKFECLESVLNYTDSLQRLLSSKKKEHKKKNSVELVCNRPEKDISEAAGRNRSGTAKSHRENVGMDAPTSDTTSKKFCYCIYMAQKNRWKKNHKWTTNAQTRIDHVHEKRRQDVVSSMPLSSSETQQMCVDVLDFDEIAKTSYKLNSETNSNSQLLLTSDNLRKKLSAPRNDYSKCRPLEKRRYREMKANPQVTEKSSSKLQNDYRDEAPSTSRAAQKALKRLKKKYSVRAVPAAEHNYEKVVSHCLMSTGSVCYVSKVHRLKDQEKSATITNFNLDIASFYHPKVSYPAPNNHRIDAKLVNHSHQLQSQPSSNVSQLILRRAKNSRDISIGKNVSPSNQVNKNRVCYERPFSNAKERYITDRIYRANMLTYKQSKTALRLMGLLE